MKFSLSGLLKSALMFLALLVVIGVEQAVGLPVVYVMLVMYVCQLLSFERGAVVAVVMGLLMAVFYQLWLGVGPLLMILGVTALSAQGDLGSRHGLRLVGVVSVINLIIAYLSHYSWQPANIIYHLVLTVLMIRVLQRRRSDQTKFQLSKFLR